ncbi:hypothetical protein PCL_11255 [Purpureocillium lilacinum]|uniref:Uncharacterized protein n=1 Tax=Purpureocillium lilacinum TaxID=33203 RepID=A0A2U3DQ11_PURLI|nr:hypothetical protein PCL_11255 [Purpureocillium lilacinum]
MLGESHPPKEAKRVKISPFEWTTESLHNPADFGAPGWGRPGGLWRPMQCGEGYRTHRHLLHINAQNQRKDEDNYTILKNLEDLKKRPIHGITRLSCVVGVILADNEWAPPATIFQPDQSRSSNMNTSRATCVTANRLDGQSPAAVDMKVDCELRFDSSNVQGGSVEDTAVAAAQNEKVSAVFVPTSNATAADDSRSAPAVPSRALPLRTEGGHFPALESSFAMPPPPGFWAEQSFHGLGNGRQSTQVS